MLSPIGFYASPVEEALFSLTQKIFGSLSNFEVSQAVPTKILRQGILDDKNFFNYKLYTAIFFPAETLYYSQLPLSHHSHETSSHISQIIYTSLYFNP